MQSAQQTRTHMAALPQEVLKSKTLRQLCRGFARLVKKHRICQNGERGSVAAEDKEHGPIARQLEGQDMQCLVDFTTFLVDDLLAVREVPPARAKAFKKEVMKFAMVQKLSMVKGLRAGDEPVRPDCKTLVELFHDVLPEKLPKWLESEVQDRCDHFLPSRVQSVFSWLLCRTVHVYSSCASGRCQQWRRNTFLLGVMRAIAACVRLTPSRPPQQAYGAEHPWGGACGSRCACPAPPLTASSAAQGVREPEQDGLREQGCQEILAAV